MPASIQADSTTMPKTNFPLGTIKFPLLNSFGLMFHFVGFMGASVAHLAEHIPHVKVEFMPQWPGF